MSLRQRIILSASIVLLIFITLTITALDRAFVDSTQSALHDRLTSQLYALMAAANISDNTIKMPSNELDALLGLPSSGMYAFITDAKGKILWHSASALGSNTPQPLTLKKGEKRFQKITHKHTGYYLYAYGVNWATDNQAIALTFNIITNLKAFNHQINLYRKTLWGWLLAMAILLLASQAVILRWGLSPLRRVGNELSNIESGKQQQIEQHYPLEIERLTSNINLLLKQEREQKTRYRNALGDLAHSLKTPLAVLQSSINNPSGQQKETMQQQINHMNAIVEYQLQRAATAGSGGISKNVNLENVINRIIESLQKVYQEKNIQVSCHLDKSLVFKGDEGDLMELLGNLLDNAFKWAHRKVEINTQQNTQGKTLCIRISDDGAGIEPEQINNILQRGIRADQTTSGHGIGLSIVCNIVDAYQGDLVIRQSALGGAEIQINL